MTRPLPPPLEGVRVLVLAHLIAGPTAGMYLADMGADVVKVESHDAPDASRSVYGIARAGEGILHLTVNRNKRALCLDLQKPAGREAFYRVVKTADVVLEGYRNGVAEKLGIDYATLAPMNPRLIYCSVSAFGPEGPWRAKPGLDALAQAVGGLMAVTGEADGGPVLVCHRHEATHRLGKGVQARLRAPRPFRAEGGDRAVDQPWVHGREGGVVDAELLRDAVAIAFEDHVGGFDHAIEGLAPCGLLEIETERALVAVHREMEDALSRPRHSVHAARGIGRLA